MGALIAGIGMSTFPYNLDVIAKVINIRDFFVTLFFVALGMQIPMPTPWVLAVAAGASLFLVATPLPVRLPPPLRDALRPAHEPPARHQPLADERVLARDRRPRPRPSGHIDARTVAVLTFVFVITSVASTYMIAKNHELQAWLGGWARRLGLRDGAGSSREARTRPGPPPSSSSASTATRARSSTSSRWRRRDPSRTTLLLRTMLVVDFNPQVLEELQRRGIRCVYGDVSNMDTLHHAAVHHARIVVCTLTDSILKGTSNARLLRQLQRLCPQAALVVASDTIEGALALYARGRGLRLHPAHPFRVSHGGGAADRRSRTASSSRGRRR